MCLKLNIAMGIDKYFEIEIYAPLVPSVGASGPIAWEIYEISYLNH